MVKYFFMTLALLTSASCTHFVAKNTTLVPFPSKTHYKYQILQGNRIFYREAGDPNNPTILLLHGFPSSSHAYRELIPLLSGQYHVIAPDNLGSGFSDHPDPSENQYTFDLLASSITSLLNKLKIDHYYIYMQDFGAPVGYRIALKSPSKVNGLIVQNANAYLQGLNKKKTNFFLTAGNKGSLFPRKKLFGLVSRRAVINKQYLRDVAQDKTYIMSPDAWTHDLAFLRSKSQKLIQVQLFEDYRSNLKSYPKWQEYLRKFQPPTLIVWGKNDPVFMSPGAEAYLKDVPKAELHLLNAGHFALEEKPVEIARYILKFLHNQQRH